MVGLNYVNWRGQLKARAKPTPLLILYDEFNERICFLLLPSQRDSSWYSAIEQSSISCY